MRIIHPRPQLGRQHDLGVDFTDGVAVVETLHPERERALLQHGFTIASDLDVEAPYHDALGEPIVDLTKLTVAELRDIAEDEGVDLPAKAKKADIVDALSRIPATPIPGSVANDDGSYTFAAPDTAGEAYIPPHPSAEIPARNTTILAEMASSVEHPEATDD